MLSGKIDHLASATVLLLLTVFVIVNIGLVILKFRIREPRGKFEVPSAIPACGAVVCAAMIGFRLYDGDTCAPMIAVGIIAFAILLYSILRPKVMVLDERFDEDRV